MIYGGGGAAGVRIFIQSRGAGGTDLRRGDKGGIPPHGQGLGGVPGPGGATSDGTDPTTENRWELGFHLGYDNKL